MLTADDTLSLDTSLAPPVLDRRQRNLWIALGFALLLHASFLVAVGRGVSEHEVRRVGSESGAEDAIAVEVVTEADLKSLSSVATPPQGGAPAPAFKPSVEPQDAPREESKSEETPPTPLEPPPPPPEAKAEPTPEPKPAEPAPAEPPPPEPKTAEPTPPEPKVTAEVKPEASPQPTPTVPDFEMLAPEFAEPTPAASKDTPPEPKKPQPEKPAPEKVETTKAEPAPKQPEAQQKQAAKPQQPPKKKQQQAKLDLSPPQTMPNTSSAGPGRSSAATRPPGITRSGENDRFGILAIRALAQTFPMLSNTFGRVTVKLLLNENGDLVDARVLQSSGKPQLDQSVLFSTKQASFPLPPRNSTELDRTFIVTYVYR